MDYTAKYFNPQRPPAALDDAPVSFAWGKGAARDVYVFAPRVVLAINVALATGRPLLVAGEPGSGKSRLSAAVAEVLGWQYYRHTVTSRTQASDLLWTFDALRRLNDASTPGEKLRSRQHYVEPGAVWWGFDPATAAQRGLGTIAAAQRARDQARGKGSKKGAVVLIDEIDKADPDVPNDLLEPFDVKQFTVADTDQRIAAKRDVFLMLTTNGERELPPAFLRRCALLVLDEPGKDWFMLVAARHFPDGDTVLHERLATEVERLRGDAELKQLRKPSTAEFLDALRVCTSLGLDEQAPIWKDVISTVLLKTERPTDATSSQPASNTGT